ncbi:hypothetical protein WJX72_008418 [[Myrmecia] bisecta]|uniref:BZIP domain-containing protein n=1 Tax=[Myrmecia] bisecta TaxID=41462 RepID=A0AAW1PHP1_9CHLO
MDLTTVYQQQPPSRRQAIQDDDEDYESPGSKPRGGKASIQDKNRRAQKRFRERAKEKEKEREQHMNELEGLVSRLKLENARLEDRNRLLEKVVEARSQPQPNALGLATPVPAVAVSASSHPTLEEAFLEDETAHIAATTFPKDLVLSMPGGQPMSLDSKQIFELSATQVWDIYEVYARKLKQCLDDGAEQDPESPAGQDLVLYTSEVCSLLLRAGAANPVTLRRLHRERNTLARRQALGDFDFDRRMAVLLELTDKQKRQMIDIGTGFRQRVMELSVERKSFYAKLQLPPGMGRGSEEAVDEFIQACELLTTLKINLRKEHWEVLNFLTKMFEICSHVQIAKFMLASLPRWFDYVAMCTVLALDAGELDLNVLIKLLGKQ